MLWDQRVVGSNPISPTTNPDISDTSGKSYTEQTGNERNATDAGGNNSPGIVPDDDASRGGLKITDVIHALGDWGFAISRPDKRTKAQFKHTYFARCVATGEIKIGRSACLEARMRELSRARKSDVVLLASIPGGDNEPMYHWWFSKHRLEGEWFSPAPEILAEIDRLKSEQPA